MEILAASSPEVQAMFQDILEHDMAKRKREELSEASFKEWVYDAVRIIFAKLGYQLQSFSEFWTDVGISISEGFRDGREQARREAALKRKLRERKY
jgi:hypothetical protein